MAVASNDVTYQRASCLTLARLVSRLNTSVMKCFGGMRKAEPQVNASRSILLIVVESIPPSPQR